MSLINNLKQNSRILITGGYGFIGHHLVKKLLKMGHKVTVIDDLSTGSISNLQPHERLLIKKPWLRPLKTAAWPSTWPPLWE